MARKDITMNEAEIAAFLDEMTVLKVASIGNDGWPHVVPMWFVVEDGNMVFRSFTKSQKIVNLRRNPALTVLVESGGPYDELRGLMIKAEAKLIVDRDYVLSIYGKLAARYAMVGPEPVELSPDAPESAFGRFAEKNTVVVVEPMSVASWDHRKLAGAY